MTTIDPVTPPPAAPPPASPVVPQFSWGLFIAGLLIAVFVGAIGNVVFGLMGASTNQKPLAALIAAIPGGFFVLVSFATRPFGFRQGLMVGGCIIALIGGACGASMTPLNFH